MYQLTHVPECIIRLSDGARIWADAGNLDYQEFQAWQAAGGVPLPADPKPPVAIPPVTRRQMFRALEQLGLLDSVVAFVATLPKSAQIDWEESNEFNRDNPTLASGAQAMGMSDAQVDDVFALARTL